MANAILPVRQGESFSFAFDLSGDSIDGWICTINVKQFPADTSQLTRVIEAGDNDTWPGIITSTETDALTPIGLYRLIGLLTNSTTGQEKQPVIRFNLTDAWA